MASDSSLSDETMSEQGISPDNDHHDITSEISQTASRAQGTVDQSSTSDSSHQEDTAGSESPDSFTPRIQRADSSLDPRSCWICLQSEKEDTARSSRWRSPCACRLQAHEACLLDWVAEEERPKPGSPAKMTVQCPQCRTRIKMLGPRSYFLPIFRRFQGLRSMAVIPATGVCLAGALAICCHVHGRLTVLAVLGPNESRKLFYALGANTPIAWWWTVTLIPPSLLVSRMSYGRNFFGFLPFVLLSSGYASGRTLHLQVGEMWPPSSLVTLSLLPWAKVTYDTLYKYLFAKKESAWIKEVQHRRSEDAQDDDEQAPNEQQNANQEAAVEGDGQVIELGFEVELEDDEEDAEPPAAVEQQEDRQQNDRPAVGEPQGPGQQQGVQERRQGGINAANAVPIILNVLLEKTLGALFFPFAAAAVGQTLKLTLPLRWVASPKTAWWGRPKATGFLQTQFGRTVAGGCLFVVLRDSVSLYSKFRMAQLHRQRRIANYDAKKREYLD